MIDDLSTDTPPLDTKYCAVEGCDREIIPNGKGRPPKYCEDHRKPSSRRPETPDTGGSVLPPKTTREPAWKKQLRADLPLLYGEIALVLMLVKPETGKAVMSSAEACTDAWISLAEKNVRVRTLLQNITSTSATMALFLAHLPILVTVLPVDSILEAVFGKGKTD